MLVLLLVAVRKHPDKKALQGELVHLAHSSWGMVHHDEQVMLTEACGQPVRLQQQAGSKKH